MTSTQSILQKDQTENKSRTNDHPFYYVYDKSINQLKLALMICFINKSQYLIFIKVHSSFFACSMAGGYAFLLLVVLLLPSTLCVDSGKPFRSTCQTV